MPHWNYRVVRYDNPTGHQDYIIHEVHYDDKGQVRFWTEIGVEPYGETLQELRDDLKAMLAALDKPVLSMTELKKTVGG